MLRKPLDLAAPQGIGIDRVGQIQSDLGSRLGTLRDNRDELVSAKSQSQINQLREQEAQQIRKVGIRGSLADRRISDIESSADLGVQQIQQQSLAQQLQSETGMQQLRDEYTASFNQMAATGFSEELSGLGEEVDRFMAKYGVEGKYSDLALKAQEATNRMIGRALQAGAEEYGRSRRNSIYNNDPVGGGSGVTGDADMPAFQRR